MILAKIQTAWFKGGLFFWFQSGFRISKDILSGEFVPESEGFPKHTLLLLKSRIPTTTTSRVAINQRQIVSDSYQDPGVPTMTWKVPIWSDRSQSCHLMSPTHCRWTRSMASTVRLRCNTQLPGCDRHIVSTSEEHTRHHGQQAPKSSTINWLI